VTQKHIVIPRPRKRAATKAKIQLNVAQRILEAVPAGICQVDPHGAISFANSVAIEFLGLSYDDLAKMYLGDFDRKVVYEDGRECPVHEYPVSRCLATGQPQPETILGVRRPDGRVSWGIFSALPVFADSGALLASVVTFIDISHRKEAERALRESEERYRQLVELCPDGILIHVADQIVFANNAMAKILGVAGSHEIVNVPFIEFVHPDFRKVVLGRARGLSEGVSQQPWHEIKIVRRDGDVVPVEAASQAVVLNGQRSIQVMVRDITQRKRADQERDQLFSQVEMARNRLELLSLQLVQVQEAERRHLARELHDHIGQELTALKLNLDRCANASADASAGILQEARGRADNLVKLVREMSLDLRPTMLDDLGLVPALHWHLDRFFGTSGVRVNFKHTGVTERRFAPDIETGGLSRGCRRL
jgi:PAS domain S-box-containing protein